MSLELNFHLGIFLAILGFILIIPAVIIFERKVCKLEDEKVAKGLKTSFGLMFFGAFLLGVAICSSVFIPK